MSSATKFTFVDYQFDQSKLDGKSAAICDSLLKKYKNCTVLPGFVDVHVHFRQPGYLYKETIRSGTRAAAAGGFTAVCTMPNLKPAPDSPENLRCQLDAIHSDATINVYPYGTITRERAGRELAQLASIADDVIAFSDDGSGISDDGLMREAMLSAKELDKIIAAHCEDLSVIGGAHVNAGPLADKLGINGISRESEWRQIERDLKLADETGVKYHVCHVSCRESVDLIRDAKKSGVDVTCETAPHYLLLDESMAVDDGAFKMNPPLRAIEDRLSLLEGIADGTVDMLATDHAPHSRDEKSGGLIGSLMGVVGLETAFPVCFTRLVKSGIISLSRLIEMMSTFPASRFGIDTSNAFTIFDLEGEYVIDPNKFETMGRSTPFAGWQVTGKCMATVLEGRIVYEQE